MNDLVVSAYVVFAFSGAAILIYVITQATHDIHLKRTDPPSVARARFLTFYGDAAFLLLTVFFKDYWLTDPSVISTGLISIGFVGGGIAILGVSLVSMKRRAPPPDNGFHTPVVRVHGLRGIRLFLRHWHEDHR